MPALPGRRAQLRWIGSIWLRPPNPYPNRAKRMECVELAPALVPSSTFDSGSKLHALHTLRAVRWLRAESTTQQVVVADVSRSVFLSFKRSAPTNVGDYDFLSPSCCW